MSSDSMTRRVRRIVTGHNADGKAVIAADEQIEGTGLAEDAGRTDAFFFALWATHEMPVDLSDEALTRQRDGSATTIIGSGSGSVLRIGVLAPGTRSPMHRTSTVDYGIVLQGEVFLVMEDSETLLHPGDIVVQRGTNHAWDNRSTEPARMVFILLAAQFAEELASTLPDMVLVP